MIEQTHPNKVPLALADALARFADEHGLPNSISPKELHELHGGPHPLDAGWHYRYNRDAVDTACAARGIRIRRIYLPKGEKMKLIEITRSI